MTNLNKLTARTLGVALLLAVPAVASADHSDIIVQPSPELVQWQQDTSEDLERALLRGGTRYTTRGVNNSIVQITFRAGPDGKPDGIEVYESDGNFAAKSLAKRAVSRLSNLNAVPVESPGNAQFLANIIFASDERTFERLEDRLAKMEAVRMASAGPDRTYIALGF